MDYKVNFKTKTMEWKTKYNGLVDKVNLLPSSSTVNTMINDKIENNNYNLIHLQVINLYGAPLNFYILKYDLDYYFQQIYAQFGIQLDLENLQYNYGQLTDDLKLQFIIGLYVYSTCSNFDGMPLLNMRYNDNVFEILYGVIINSTGNLVVQQPMNEPSQSSIEIL